MGSNGVLDRLPTWLRDRIHDGPAPGEDRSAHDYGTVCYLIRQGWTDEKIMELWENSEHGFSAKVCEEGRNAFHYMEHTLGNARAEVESIRRDHKGKLSAKKFMDLLAGRAKKPDPSPTPPALVANAERVASPPRPWKPPRTIEELIEAGKKPVAWVIDRLIVEGGVSAIFGPPKSIKSTIVLALLMSLRNGKPLCPEWKVGAPAPCGFVTWEDSIGRLGRRILVNQRQTGPLIPEVWDKANAPEVKLPFDEAQLIEMIRRHGWKALVVDVMIYLTTAESENDNAAMQPLCASAQRIVSATGVAFILIHHSRKMQENGRFDIRESARGASVISGMADSLIHVQAARTGGYLLKALPKDAAESDWKLDYDSTSAVPWTIKPGLGDDANKADILNVLTKLGGATRAIVADELDISKNTASKSLGELLRSGEVTSEVLDNRGTIMYRINKRVT